MNDVMGNTVPQFDLSTIINRAKEGDSRESPSTVSSKSSQLKKIPNGTMITGIRQGEYQDKIKVGDFAIIVERKVKRFLEIVKVNSRTLIVEKERTLTNGQVTRYTCKLKRIDGIISVG